MKRARITYVVPIKIDREKLRKVATITLRCEDEDIPFVGNCSALDPETDRKQEDWIRSELASGNEWAWCRVVVTASWNLLTGADSLGGCSYESEDDFQDGPYYSDMVRTAIDRLAEQIEAIATQIEAESLLAEESP